MEQYIKKSALVAEIKRLKKEDGNPYFPSETADKYYARGVHFTCDGLVNFLDTLEVKEVDLDEETDLEYLVKEFCYEFDDRKDKWYEMTPHDKNIMTNPTWSNFAMQLAKHFFELGIKAQKGR